MEMEMEKNKEHETTYQSPSNSSARLFLPNLNDRYPFFYYFSAFMPSLLFWKVDRRTVATQKQTLKAS
jgi:hypothetical protein